MGIISVKSKTQGYKNIIKTQTQALKALRDENVKLKARICALDETCANFADYINSADKKARDEGIVNKAIEKLSSTSKKAYTYIPKIKVENMPKFKINF